METNTQVKLTIYNKRAYKAQFSITILKMRITIPQITPGRFSLSMWPTRNTFIETMP